MQKIGFIGIGKIGLPICGNLIKGGYAVVGYRRSSLAEFEKLGGVPAQSAADVGAQTEIVFTCLPDAAALDEVVRGPQGLLKSARHGQIVIELGSHRLPVKRRYVALLKERGVEFLDGEVSGTPGMVAQRKGVIYLGGPADAVKTVEPVVAGFADLCMHLGPFGSATKVKLVNNLLVALHIAGAAQAMAIGCKIGVDPELLIKAVAQGSGGSTQFAIRAPWMAERRFTPAQGLAGALAHYLDGCKDLADEVGVATPVLDCLIDVFARATPGIGERDVAAMVEFFEGGNLESTNSKMQKEQTT
jgi:3-hydroxyisobutyrate dehydrogenase-like beta-hydroxyacid dehydrogenase